MILKIDILYLKIYQNRLYINIYKNKIIISAKSSKGDYNGKT